MTMKSIFVSTVSTIALVLVCACSKVEKVPIFPVKIGDHWGYINEKGKYVVNPIFDSADYFSCGVARYTQEGKIGYLKPNGKNAIDPIYARGTTFSEDKAFVVRDGAVLECINPSGKVLFQLDGIEWAYNFHDGLSRVVDNDGRVGFVNTSGEIVIDIQFVRAGDFYEGLAYAETENESGYIDRKGNFIFQANPDKMYVFSDGLAINNIGGGQYGYIDKKGNIKIPFQFDVAYNFSEGLACVKIGDSYGFIDKTGSYVVNPQFDYAGSFSEGLAIVGVGGRYGYINSKGKIVIESIFSDAIRFNGGYAFVENSDGKYGLINKKGEFVVKPQFTKAKAPSDIVSVRSGKFNGKEFVPEFLKRYSAEGWDGLNGSTSLMNIRALYKKAKAYGDNDFVCETSFDAVDGVKLTYMFFGFGEKTYKVVKNYSSFFGYTYENGTKRQYFDSLPLKTLQYVFSLEGNAVQKAKSVAETLAAGISDEYGVPCENTDMSLTIPASDHSPKTILTWSPDYVSLTLEYFTASEEVDNVNSET